MTGSAVGADGSVVADGWAWFALGEVGPPDEQAARAMIRAMAPAARRLVKRSIG
jgi:hypothetical protein